MLIAIILAAALAGPPAEPKTVDTVLRADEAWGFAESHGNSEFLEHLLLPGYVSVGPDGSITTKKALVEKARSRSQEELKDLQARVSQWRKNHPTLPNVVIRGDTAVLQWTSPTVPPLISSVDVFVYEGGHWHAAYSQHSAASR